VATLACVLAGVAPVRAESNDHIPRIRTTDRRIRSLIDEGVRLSPTFHDLVDRVEAADVVVYVQCDAFMTTRIRGGRLTFVSAAGGFRYVVVRMQWLPSPQHQIALLAHELQHAVEIGDTPAIVDSASLAREYRRMGETRDVSGGSETVFDTRMANAVGHRVLKELGRSSRSERSNGVD
jgi:hypothetical protein